MNEEKKSELESQKKKKRKFQGVVVSDKMDKTIVVKLTAKKMHSKYQKQFKVSKSYSVHDEKKVAKIGDLVSFEECRPLSKSKKWRLIEVIKK